MPPQPPRPTSLTCSANSPICSATPVPLKMTPSSAHRVGRLVRGFVHDHPGGVTRDQARILFREIGKALEDTDEGDARRTELAHLRRRYELDSEPLEQVPDYGRFKQELSGLRLQERLARQDRPQEPALLAELATDDTPTPADDQDAPPREVVAALPTRAARRIAPQRCEQGPTLGDSVAT